MTPDLSQLRDIHPPNPISWWPPAPGWWFLMGLTLVLVVLGMWWFRLHRRERWRRVALNELVRLRHSYRSATNDPHDTVRFLSILIRRVALTRFPRTEVASLNGEAWLAFLDHALGGGDPSPFQKGAGRCLATIPYMAPTRIEVDELFQLAERWVKALH